MHRQVMILAGIMAFTALVSGQGFIHIPGKLVHVSGGLNYVWGVNRADDIFVCQRPCTGSNWQHIPGKLVQVDVDDTEVWGVNVNDDIFKRPIDGSGSWQQVPGKLVHVTASGNGYIWGVNVNGAIFNCKKPCSGQWTHIGAGLSQIDGGDREVYGVNFAEGVFTGPVDGSETWRYIPGGFKQITAGGVYDVFAVDGSDNIYRCRKPCVGEWIQLDPGAKLAQCDATVNALFGINSNDDIFRRDFPL